MIPRKGARRRSRRNTRAHVRTSTVSARTSGTNQICFGHASLAAHGLVAEADVCTNVRIANFQKATDDGATSVLASMSATKPR